MPRKKKTPEQGTSAQAPAQAPAQAQSKLTEEQKRWRNSMRSKGKVCDATTTIQGRPKTPGTRRGGRLNKDDLNYVIANIGKETPEAMAHKLDKRVEYILKVVERHTGVKQPKKTTLVEQLQRRPEWRQFKQQFNDEELEEFKHQYVQMVSGQFKDDLLPTEELQVFQVITLKIQIDRTLAEQKAALLDMQLYHKELEALRSGESADGAPGSPDKARIEAIESRYEAARRVNKDCAERYKIWSDKQDKMFSSLKATRDQRVKIYENSKHSILGLVRLLMEEGQRDSLGAEAGMMQVAADREREKLTRPHQYADKTWDQPLLTPDNVLDDDELPKEVGNETDEGD